MSWVEAVFVLLSLVALGSGLLVVTTPHMVHAALWLVVTLGSVAGIFLVLAAEFVAWVQVLIYVGAVVVLLLFALMLTKAPTGRTDDLTVRRAAPAAVVAVLVGVLLAATVVAGFHDVRIDLDGHRRRLGGDHRHHAVHQVGAAVRGAQRAAARRAGRRDRAVPAPGR